MDKHIEKRLEYLSQRLAELYDQESYEEATKVAEERRELTNRHFGENHPDHATALNDLAVLYTETGNSHEAEKLHLKALEIRQASHGENQPDYAESLHNLAHLYDSTGDYAKARPLYEKAIEIFRNSVGENNPQCKESIQSLAELAESITASTDKIIQLGHQSSQLSKQGDNDQALTVAQKAGEMIALCFGENSQRYAAFLNHLGTMYFTARNFSKSGEALKEAIRIYESSSDEEFKGYTATLFNLAILYRTTGKLIQAEQLLKQLAALKAEALGENHHDYADTLMHLAWLYHATARNKQAEQLYKKVIEIGNVTSDKHNVEHERSLSDLANLYMSDGRYAEAEPLYRHVEEAKRASQEANHPSYVASLMNLERLHSSMGKLEQADSLLRQRMNIQKNHSDLFPDAANSNEINKELYANFQITPTIRSQHYWPPLQVGLDEAAVLFYGAGYSSKQKSLNEELSGLYARGSFEEARFLLDRKFSLTSKSIDKHEIKTEISRLLRLNSIQMKQLDAFLCKNKSIWDFLSCPELLKFFCNRVEQDMQLLEDPPLNKELGLYEAVVDLMLNGDFPRRNHQLFKFFSRQRQTGSDDMLLLLEELALASFVNKQTVFQEEIANVFKYAANPRDEYSFKNIYQQTNLLQALSPSDYAFYNRTFHEYMTARAMYRRISDHLQEAWVSELNKFWDPSYFWDEYWSNTIRMFLGFLPAEKHPEFLKTCARCMPEDLGYLEESKLEKGQPLIVMINTSYTSAAVNEKIAKILGFFAETGALHCVFTEGDDGPIDRSFYQNIEKIPDDTVKKQLAKTFLKKMTISGHEYLAITSWQKFHLWGIDNEPLWAKLLKHLKEIAYETRDIKGNRKRSFLVYARAQSMSSTMRSVIIERDAKISAMVMGYPYFLPFPNAYEKLSANKSDREPFLLSYIKISPTGLEQATPYPNDRYKEIMQGKNLV
jgi:tetratricopeptide (TPR) repeat protein